MPRVASRDEWTAARKVLLEREKALTRDRDALNAERRALPMVLVDKPYVFETRAGQKSRPAAPTRAFRCSMPTGRSSAW